MKKLQAVLYATLAVAFLFMVCLQDSSASGVRVGGGFDGIHAQGTPFVYGATEHFTLLYSQTTGPGVGASFRVSRRGWDLGFGAVVLSKTNELNGTHLNWLFDLGYTFGDWGVRVMHISNGRKLGIGPDDKPNDGWNIITIERNF